MDKDGSKGVDFEEFFAKFLQECHGEEGEAFDEKTMALGLAREEQELRTKFKKWMEEYVVLDGNITKEVADKIIKNNPDDFDAVITLKKAIAPAKISVEDFIAASK